MFEMAFLPFHTKGKEIHIHLWFVQCSRFTKTQSYELLLCTEVCIEEFWCEMVELAVAADLVTNYKRLR